MPEQVQISKDYPWRNSLSHPLEDHEGVGFRLAGTDDVRGTPGSSNLLSVLTESVNSIYLYTFVDIFTGIYLYINRLSFSDCIKCLSSYLFAHVKKITLWQIFLKYNLEANSTERTGQFYDVSGGWERCPLVSWRVCKYVHIHVYHSPTCVCVWRKEKDRLGYGKDYMNKYHVTSLLGVQLFSEALAIF